MGLPTINPQSHILVRPEPLTPSAFAQFGRVVTSPLPSTVTSYPSTIPQPPYPAHQPLPIPANQTTALKTSPISPLINNYPSANNSTRRVNPGTGLMSIFSSFPRQNTYLNTSKSTNRQSLKLKVGILERHPFTTQTFCPFNYSEAAETNTTSTSTASSSTSTQSSTVGNNDSDTRSYMLILVAPTLASPTSKPPNPPSLPHLRAFIAPLNDPTSPTPAVTYASGTWHAPMIVLGPRRVDFLVTQFANGVAEDDCQEVLVGSGPDESTLSDDERRKRERSEPSGVEVDVSFLLPGYDEALVDLEGKWTTDEAVFRAVSASERAKL